MITISVNDIFDKIMGNEEEIIIKRNNEADDLVLLTAKNIILYWKNLKS